MRDKENLRKLKLESKGKEKLLDSLKSERGSRNFWAYLKGEKLSLPTLPAVKNVSRNT